LDAANFFWLVLERYEHGSPIFTSNTSFTNWRTRFGDQMLASALLDRLLHHATTINIRSNSYRMKDKLRAGVTHALKSVMRLVIQATNLVPNEYRPDLAPSFSCFLRIPDGSAPPGERFFLKRSHRNEGKDVYLQKPIERFRIGISTVSGDALNAKRGGLTPDVQQCTGGGLSFRSARDDLGLGPQDDGGAGVHRMMNEITQMGFLAGALSIKAGIRIGHAPVGPVGKPLPPKIARLL